MVASDFEHCWPNWQDLHWQQQEFVVIFYKMNLEAGIVPTKKLAVLVKTFSVICHKFYVGNVLHIVLQKLVSSLEKYW